MDLADFRCRRQCGGYPGAIKPRLCGLNLCSLPIGPCSTPPFESPDNASLRFAPAKDQLSPHTRMLRHEQGHCCYTKRIPCTSLPCSWTACIRPIRIIWSTLFPPSRRPGRVETLCIHHSQLRLNRTPEANIPDSRFLLSQLLWYSWLPSFSDSTPLPQSRAVQLLPCCIFWNPNCTIQREPPPL